MNEHLKTIVETLYPMNRYLLGVGYDNALEYIKHLINLEILEFPSGMQFGTWTVPEEWEVRDATVRYVGEDPGNPLTGEDFLDFKNNPLSVVVGSGPIRTRVNREELRKHWNYSDEKPDGIPFGFNYYGTRGDWEEWRTFDWGLCFPRNKIRTKVSDEGLIEGVKLEGLDYVPQFKDALPEGYYDVEIDASYKPGVMKLGVHTIKGTSDREILLFAHLDHPYQANDNLSGVACLIDLATKLKAEHTIKIIFCPETIGSIAYTLSQDITKVDFVIAIDICGNKNSFLLQKAYDEEHKINRVAHLALQSLGETYRKGQFRNTIGSDEYAFNDPKIGIPGIMLSTWPYPEYHTSFDSPDKIDYEQIEKTQKAIIAMIEIWEADYIPERNFKGPLMRARYGIQTPNKQVNLMWDYFIYAIDGKRSLAELCCDYGLNFTFVHDVMERMVVDGFIIKHENRRAPRSKKNKSKASK